MSSKRAKVRVTSVVVLTTAMLTFIPFWRAAAIVLCDMASTAWYIGGISEKAVGPAAPWAILAVMLFSACVLAMYVEASSMFVRGGVYKVVKESMGGTMAKLSDSALMFDYVLTGAISSVSAGQYVAGLLNSLFPLVNIGWKLNPAIFASLFAVGVTLYFWEQNIRGIEESSDKAWKIIRLVAVMGLVVFAWGAATALVRGFHWPSLELSFTPDSLGWLKNSDWHRRIGAVGMLIAFGHAFLGMSGLETRAQVYREMEAPKLFNLKRAAIIIFVFAFLLTTGVSFLAVGLIPEELRAHYSENLLAGLAMSMLGPHWLRLALQAFVVLVGAVILAGAVNTAIMGANGVMNRLAEDGVLPDWFRFLHHRYGTTHRMVNLIVAMQIGTILLCRGDLYLLGEAYAFGVIWSFVFMSLAVVALRFKDRGAREWMVPLNLRIGETQWPVGLSFIFAVLLAVGGVNLLTKRVATISGLIFTAFFFILFYISERINRKAGGHLAQDHREKLNLRHAPDLSTAIGAIVKPNRVLVALADPNRLAHLSKALETLDSETTDLVAMHSKVERGLGFEGEMTAMGPEEELLFTRVITLAEKSGKTVIPLLVVSKDPAYAVSQAAQAVGAQEVVIGISGRVSLEVQLERLAMTWGAQQTKESQPVRFRILGDGKEMTVDL